MAMVDALLQALQGTQSEKEQRAIIKNFLMASGDQSWCPIFLAISNVADRRECLTRLLRCTPIAANEIAIAGDSMRHCAGSEELHTALSDWRPVSSVANVSEAKPRQPRQPRLPNAADAEGPIGLAQAHGT